MKGTVEKIDRIRVAGKTPFDALVIDGEKYSCFDTGASKDIQVGHVVEFDFETSGEYKNIKKIAVVTGKVEEGNGPAIARSVGVKVAGRLAAARGWSLPTLFVAAEKIKRYIETGEYEPE